MLTFVEDFYEDLAGELLIALGMGIGNAAVFKMVPKYVPEAVGGASGLVGGLGAIGGFIIPPFLGATVDALGKQGYAGGFFAYVVLAAIAIVVAWNFHRINSRRRARYQTDAPSGSLIPPAANAPPNLRLSPSFLLELGWTYSTLPKASESAISPG